MRLLCLSEMGELCYVQWYAKRFFFLARGAFRQAGNECWRRTRQSLFLENHNLPIGDAFRNRFPSLQQSDVATILSLPERPTALCVWSDHYALPVIHELRSNGVRVPEDMSVAGHDGSDVAASIKLTTMAQPAREIGRIAARKTLDLVAKKTLDEPRTIIQTVLTPGDTTQPIAHE